MTSRHYSTVMYRIGDEQVVRTALDIDATQLIVDSIGWPSDDVFDQSYSAGMTLFIGDNEDPATTVRAADRLIEALSAIRVAAQAKLAEAVPA